MRKIAPLIALLVTALSAVFGVSTASAAASVPSGVTSGWAAGYCYVAVGGDVYANGSLALTWNYVSCAVSSGYGACGVTSAGVLTCANGFTRSGVLRAEWKSRNIWTTQGSLAVTYLNGDFEIYTFNGGLVVALSGTVDGVYSPVTFWRVLDAPSEYGFTDFCYVRNWTGYFIIGPWEYHEVVWVSTCNNEYVVGNQGYSYVQEDWVWKVIINGTNYYTVPWFWYALQSAAFQWFLDSDWYFRVFNNWDGELTPNNRPSSPVRDAVMADVPWQGVSFCGVQISDNKFGCWTLGSAWSLSSAPASSGGGSSSPSSDPALLCVDNSASSGSVSFRSVVATGTGYEYDLSLSTVDESWTYPSERSLWLKGVDIAGHSDGPSLAAWGTGRFVVEKGSVFSIFDDPFVEVRSLSGSINFYRAFFTGSTAYEYKTVYVENGSGNDATFFRRIVDVTASELRTVGDFSFVMPKPLDWYRPVGFRVVLKSDDRYHFSEFRLGTYSLSADSCVPDTSWVSPDPSAGSGSGSSVPPSSSVPGSPDVAVPDYPAVDQSCVPKYFSGSFVSVATSENLDPSSCAWRTVSGSFRCQDSSGHLCSVDADACLPEIANPSQYSSGSVEYTWDVTRYECSAGQTQCLWYSKKTCGPSVSCYQDGDYCRVKPGEENPDYSSSLGTVTYSWTPAVDSSLDISNLGAFWTGRVSVSGVSQGVGSFSGVAPLTALTESGFCDMFNSDGSFAYYSDGEPFAVTLSVSWIIPIAWVENNIVPYVDRLIGSVTAPVNNLWAVFRTLGTFPEGSKICVLGRVAEVRYQSSLKSLDDEKHIVGFQYGRMGFFDYLFLFVFGVMTLLLAKKSLSNL